MTRNQVIAFLLQLTVVGGHAAAEKARPDPTEPPPLMFEDPIGATPQQVVPPPDDGVPACDELNPISMDPPELPSRESLAAPKGSVTIAFRIEASGEVSEVRLTGMHVVKGTRGWAIDFAEKAIDSIRQWRYPRQEGPCRTTQEFTYEIVDSPTESEESPATQ